MNVITKVMNQELIQLQFALTFHQVARMSKVTQTWWFRAGFYGSGSSIVLGKTSFPVHPVYGNTSNTINKNFNMTYFV